ncbi:platelet endothelial cell adhesion molecule-like isoform X4 [Eleutherodactylus coqui]|uniref:platelet endothelial cell adhesion molecule-like isoform X4 n=1 Tax=Eleutherodactylus coqui TaxID=57060 RepID=UPI00346205C9
MYLPIIVTVLGFWSVTGQASDFTINSIELNAVPSTILKNGDNLVLECVVKFTKSKDFVLNSTITFYKDDNKIHTTSTIEDRVSLTIPVVRVSHSGPYKCDVSVASRPKTSDNVEIKVTGLFPPHINVSKNEVNQGDDVTVRCEAPEEKSIMLFKFYKIKNQTVDETKSKTTNDNYQEVKFNIKEGEQILHFKCDVSLVLIGEISPYSESKHVTVLAPFSTPRIEVLPSLNFTEGKNMSVKCSVQKSPKRLDDMKVTLQKDGHIINSSTTSTLSYFRVATVDDMGEYTCTVESERTSKSRSIKIDIAELFARPNLTLSSKKQYINEGDYISLKCSVAGLATNVSRSLAYKFILNGVKTFKREGGKFSLSATENYSGSYVCQVTVSNITKVSEPLHIQAYAPVKNLVLTYMSNNKTVVLGDTLELTCKCESGTPPITYSLFQGNQTLGQKTMQGNMEARFLVNSSKSHDLGQYRCKATNRNTQHTGKYSNIVNVTIIIPISSVDLEIIPSSGNVEEGSELSLICRVKDGTLPINFKFYKMKGNKFPLRNVTEREKLYAVYELPTFSKQGDGTYICVASNGAHKEVRSNSKDAKAVLATWKKGVIGTFVTLIILAAIAICAYMHMDKKRKGKDSHCIISSIVKAEGQRIRIDLGLALMLFSCVGLGCFNVKLML